MIIGLCGTSIPGRAEAAAYLITKGFSYHSPLLEVEEEAKKKGQNTQEGKRRLREDYTKKYGKAVFLKRILDRLRGQNAIIDCITSREELNLLKKRANFCLVGVYSPNEVRFERAYAKDLLETGDTDKRKEVTEYVTELSILMQALDVSIIYPSPPSAIIAKLDEIIKKNKPNDKPQKK